MKTAWQAASYGVLPRAGRVPPESRPAQKGLKSGKRFSATLSGRGGPGLW